MTIPQIIHDEDDAFRPKAGIRLRIEDGSVSVDELFGSDFLGLTNEQASEMIGDWPECVQELELLTDRHPHRVFLAVCTQVSLLCDNDDNYQQCYIEFDWDEELTIKLYEVRP